MHSKPKNLPDFLDFGKNGPKVPDFCRKWVPGLKIAISQNHLKVYNSRTKWARDLKFGQVVDKND